MPVDHPAVCSSNDSLEFGKYRSFPQLECGTFSNESVPYCNDDGLLPAQTGDQFSGGLIPAYVEHYSQYCADDFKSDAQTCTQTGSN